MFTFTCLSHVYLLGELQQLHPLSEDLGVSLSQLKHHGSFPLVHRSPKPVPLVLRQCLRQAAGVHL